MLSAGNAEDQSLRNVPSTKIISLKPKVNPETQNGTKIRLKGKGFPVYKKENEFGDLYVSFSVKIPTGLSEKQKELFKELSKSSR